MAALAAMPTTANAQAWTQPKGEGEVIFKYEPMTADEAYDPSGALVPLPGGRRDDALGMFAQYGLTDRVTLRLKAEWQSGEDVFVDYEGRGPTEIGIAWRPWSNARTSTTLSVAYADGGDGRNAAYAAPGQGDHDWEVRAAVGRSFSGKRWLPSGFGELQVARRMRSGLPDETRADSTLGLYLGRNWMLLSQAYAGETEAGNQWVTTELSAVRQFGDWRLQAGWRDTTSGVETPRTHGWVVGVWKKF